MFFHTADIMNVSSSLRQYEVVFLAALVGMDREEKVRVIKHLADHIAPGTLLLMRSANGARAFLYPVIDPRDLQGFEVLSVFHPSDDVINSVIIARKNSQG
ncbi:nicotianamine synthase-like [Populus alba x Populus x berolinensis]|nr:nicotianamine synthase-like [Populus alba x Populus x berolinensis]